MVGSPMSYQNQEELKNENRKYTIRTAIREQHMARHHPNRYGGRSEAGASTSRVHNRRRTGNRRTHQRYPQRKMTFI